MEKLSLGDKPVLGVPLGNFRITIRYAGQAFFTELEGRLSDATTLFTNPDLQDEFKDVILEEINYLQKFGVKKPKQAKTEPEKPESKETPVDAGNPDGLELAPIQAAEKTPIEKAIDAFKQLDFTKVCNVLILEEGFRQKHLVLQVGRLHTVTEYASYNDRSQWNFARGRKVECTVSGLGLSFAHPKLLMDLGEVYIHLIIPDDHRKNSDTDVQALTDAKILTEIIPFIPQALDVKEHLKAKDDIIASKDDALKAMRIKLGEKSIRLDGASIAVSGHETKNPQDLAAPKRFDLTDAVLIGVPLILLALVGSAFGGFGWFGGMVLGFFGGIGLVSRRR